MVAVDVNDVEGVCCQVFEGLAGFGPHGQDQLFRPRRADIVEKQPQDVAALEPRLHLAVHEAAGVVLLQGNIALPGVHADQPAAAGVEFFEGPGPDGGRVAGPAADLEDVHRAAALDGLRHPGRGHGPQGAGRGGLAHPRRPFRDGHPGLHHQAEVRFPGQQAVAVDGVFHGVAQEEEDEIFDVLVKQPGGAQQRLVFYEELDEVLEPAFQCLFHAVPFTRRCRRRLCRRRPRRPCRRIFSGRRTRSLRGISSGWS